MIVVWGWVCETDKSSGSSTPKPIHGKDSPRPIDGTSSPRPSMATHTKSSQRLSTARAAKDHARQEQPEVIHAKSSPRPPTARAVKGHPQQEQFKATHAKSSPRPPTARAAQGRSGSTACCIICVTDCPCRMPSAHAFAALLCVVPLLLTYYRM